MSRPRPATEPAGAPPEARQLAVLVELLAAVDLRPGDPPRIVRTSDAAGPPDPAAEVELGVLALEAGDHPLAFLAGFVAPPAWRTLGVVCTGRARPVGDPGGPAEPVRIVQVVGRGGAWATSWTPLGVDGDSAPPGVRGGGTASGSTSDAPTGRVDDALRRALGLPTPPPAAGTELLWATQWLDALLAEAVAPPGRRSRRRPSLAALVATHPAVAAFDLDPSGVSVAGLVAAGARLAALRPWAGLRSACAGRRWSHPEVPGDVAAWLDDGAFARWVLGGYPDLDQLLGALGELLAPSASSVLTDVLAGWGLTARPDGPP